MERAFRSNFARKSSKCSFAAEKNWSELKKEPDSASTLCERLCIYSKGRSAFTNEMASRGSVFEVELPGRTQPWKLLVVEDEEALADGLRYNFEQEGYDVVLAGDGPTALDRFEHDADPFDLIILDLDAAVHERLRNLRKDSRDRCRCSDPRFLSARNAQSRQGTGVRLRNRSVHDQAVRASGIAGPVFGICSNDGGLRDRRRTSWNTAPR